MARVTKEEKIRRLKAQIEAIEKGVNPNSNIVYENTHFYVKRRGGRQCHNAGKEPYIYELHIKSAGTVSGENLNYQRQGYKVFFTDIGVWLSDAVKVAEFLYGKEQD